MSMTVSVVNTNGIQYEQHGTDKQKVKAEKFINMDNAETTRMAIKNYNKKHRESDKQLYNKLSTTIKSVPLIAVASSLALKQGGKAAFLNGASWALALGAPVVVNKVNIAATKLSPKLNDFEEKHSKLAFMSGLTASVGTFLGMEKLLNKTVESPKMLAHPKVKHFTDNLKTGADNLIEKAKNSIKMPEGLKNLTSKIKLPEKLANGLENFKNSETVKTITTGLKSTGKTILKKAPIITLAGVGVAVLHHIFKESNTIANNKAKIHNSQLETAKQLVNAYSAENASLKEANTAAGLKLAELNANNETYVSSDEVSSSLNDEEVEV